MFSMLPVTDCGIFLVSDEVSGTPTLEGLYLQGKHQVHAKNAWKTLCGAHAHELTDTRYFWLFPL